MNAPTLRDSAAYWKQVLDAGRVSFVVVQVAHEIINDAQLAANDIVVPLELPDQPPSRTVNSPIPIIGAEKVKPGAAPRLGEHGEDILQELGFSASEIVQHHGSGAVAPFQSTPGAAHPIPAAGHLEKTAKPL